MLSCKINNLSITDFTALPIDEAITFLENIQDKKANYIIKPLREQLQALSYVGLNYLTLDRQTPSLSGGESQRIKLIRHLNSPLTDLVYIIDEPSVGLHPEDIEKINDIMKSIRDKGNTVLVVEHDPDVIRIADHVIDIGPEAGKHGGEITFTGTYQELLDTHTATGKALNRSHHIKKNIRQPENFIHLKNINNNNLKNVSIDIPKNILSVLTGVAGSGKSSLLKVGLYNRSDTTFIDQKPVHASNRSNLLTYMDLFDEVREFYSNETGLKKSMFSYNSEGACPECNGKGVIKTELAFMPDFSQICEVCKGTRYRPEVLAAKVNGYSIADVLALTVEEGIDMFSHNHKIYSRLNHLQATGLHYMTLGQSLDTLSGGEIQRVKLSRYLDQSATDEIFVFDEPTTGLHEDDIPTLLSCFEQLIEQGNTVIIIEHNLTMMTHADWIIDVGPGAGMNGGHILYSGPPQGILDVDDSFTAKHLKRYID